MKNYLVSMIYRLQGLISRYPRLTITDKMLERKKTHSSALKVRVKANS